MEATTMIKELYEGLQIYYISSTMPTTLAVSFIAQQMTKAVLDVTILGLQSQLHFAVQEYGN